MNALFARSTLLTRTVMPKIELLSYMKLLDIPLGWIIHFNELKLADGISRRILPGANRE